jgi:hypothetical protein
MTRSYNYDAGSYARQSRGVSYQTSHGRYMNPIYYEGSRHSRRGNDLPPHEDSHSDPDSEDPKNRKRIPVAVSPFSHSLERFCSQLPKLVFAEREILKTYNSIVRTLPQAEDPLQRATA